MNVTVLHDAVRRRIAKEGRTQQSVTNRLGPFRIQAHKKQTYHTDSLMSRPM